MPPRKNKTNINLSPLNENQARYIDALNNREQVIVTGYSGTGKTYIAAIYASQMFQQGLVEKIILTRPSVSVGRDLGYFPGTLLEKITPWAQPVLDVLTLALGKTEVTTYIKEGKIEIAPLSTMRGRSFENAFIILDEAQNTTYDEIKMFLTRIGENCKVVINGDIRQSDLRGGASGLAVLTSIVDRWDLDVPMIDFDVDDIVRSKVCKDWIINFDRYERSWPK
jgi:phosphate starvation-inducible protein PhoH and related proteins